VSLASCLCLGAVSAAEASDIPYLHKRTARKVAVKDMRTIARDYYNGTDWATSWDFWVERIRTAKRRGSHKIDFDASLTLYDDAYDFSTTCDLRLRVWRYRDGPESDLVTDSFVVSAFDPDRDCWDSG
jgi:hypothetical protein